MESIWESKGQAFFAREKILPSGCVDLLINLGPPHWLLDPDTGMKAVEYRTTWLSGMQERFVLTESPRDVWMIGVRLYGLGAYTFLGAVHGELSNTVVDLDLLLGRAALALRERLAGTPGAEARLRLTESFVAAHIERGASPDHGIAWAQSQITAREGQVRIGELQRELGLSRKGFAARFRRYVGLSPKSFAGIQRFQSVVRLLAGSRAPGWAEVAQDCGYHDQAHFYHDFRNFCGCTPPEFLRARIPDGGMVAD